MGALLNFFGGGALQLKALIIGAGVALIACLALTTWALFERSGRLSGEVELATAKAQKAILVDQLTRQTGAVVDLAAIGAAVRDGIKGDLARIEKAAGKQAPALQRLEDLLKRPPPTRADGTPADCRDAWQQILQGVKP